MIVNIIKFYIACFIICCNYNLFSSAYCQEAPKNLGKNINSPYDELSSVISEDGNTMYFTRRKHPDNIGGTRDAGDIWMSTKGQDGAWSPASNMGAPLNNIFMNEIIGLSPDGNLMYLENHYREDGSKATSQGISVATKSGNAWSFPKPLDIPYFYNKSDHQSASLHSSGKIMVLSLQSFDTRGAEDIYVIFQQGNGTWSEPMNLGAGINTTYQEMTPFLAPDGETLYFASNGYDGYGSRDIYKSKRLDNSWKIWSAPENLGPEINTSGVEIYYNFPKNSAFAFLSSTQNSDGLGDINMVPVPEDEEQTREEPDIEVAIPRQEPEPEVPMATETLVKGKISNASNSEPLEASLLIIPMDSTVNTERYTTRANSEGEYEIMLPANGNFTAQVSANGYLVSKDKLLLRQLSASGAVIRDFLLTPLEVGATIQLSNVLFERGTTNMIGNSTEDLVDVVALMKENPEMVIEVAGHTDNSGRPDLNLLLSQDRADAVKSYLVNQGVREERIIAKGYGGSKPIASNKVEEERRKNRRVEFTILKK